MSAPDDGGPAFPEAGMTGLPNGEVVYGQPGMTLRDYFAAAALTGIISNPNVDASVTFAEVANRAFMQADAMLQGRAL